MIILLLLFVPVAVAAQEPMLVVPEDGPSLIEQLPALLPPALERLLSYATLLGVALVALANMMGNALNRWRAAGRTVPAWLDLVVGLMLDAGTDLGALRSRLLK